MVTAILTLCIGTLVLYSGAELLVRNSARMALAFGVSPLVVGLTIVAFGTSAPELAVSIKAGLGGSADIAMGNVIGSNIFNIAVILGLCAVVSPLKVNLAVLKFDAPILLAVTLLVVFFLGDSRIGRIEGGVLVSGLAVFTAATVVLARRSPGQRPDSISEGNKTMSPHGVLFHLAMIAAGLVVLVFGSHLFVKGAMLLATMAGVPESVVALTIVAAGTSLPELATSLVAAARREADIAVGNVIGSNIFNLLAVLGTSSITKPLIMQGIGPLDIGFMVTTAILIFVLMWTRFSLTRLEGIVLLAIYASYLFLLWP